MLQFLLLGVLISLGGGSIIQMKDFEKRLDPISLNSETERKIIFYRDDCSDCQSIFPLLYYHNQFKKDLVFVNMNQPLNRRYIHEYNLKSVPTIIHKEDRYEGTNRKRIQAILKE